MRLAALLLVVSLLLPLAAGQDDIDWAEEARDGAHILLYLEYSGGGSGARQGAQDAYALSEEVAYQVEWSASSRLMPDPSAPGEFQGAATIEWNASASRTYVYDWRGSATNARHEERTCGGSAADRVGSSVRGRIEGDTLRLTIDSFVPSMTVKDGCAWWQETTTSDGVQHREGTNDLVRPVPLHMFLDDASYQHSFDVVVPLTGRTVVPSSYSTPTPAPRDAPERHHCGLSDSLDWAVGSCAAQGTLTVHSWVEPCDAIERRLQQRVDALAGVAPPAEGADEAAVAAWAATVRPQVAAVLGDARAYMLMCGEDLPVEPWGAIVRAHRMHRDALLTLADRGELSAEGVDALLGAERTLQMMGIDDQVDLSSLTQDAAPRPVSGTMEVRVHSPVALHAWSDDGGHVGWNASTNTSESTIPNATYEGAPGGAQRIVLPAGHYRITVDEMEFGTYLLDVRTDGDGAGSSESWLVPARPGRTTSTHYGVLSVDDEVALETFPVHRTPTGAANGASETSDGTATDAAAQTEDNDTPPASVGAALVLMLVAARLRRRRA